MKLVRWWRGKDIRVRLAVTSLLVVAVGYPATAIALILGVPLFQHVMLALSWLAPAYTAVDILFTAQVREHQEQNGPPE